MLIWAVATMSCTDRLESEYVAADKVSTNISVVVPNIPDAAPKTRAMAMAPQMQNLYLAVFDNNGYLLEYVQATTSDTNDDGNEDWATTNETQYEYEVVLTPTDFPTTIHFIGNAPSKIDFGSETEAIGQLYTENGNEAYWQRIHLPEGIKKSGTTLDPEVITALNDIRLVRNFAWIKLSTHSSVDNFKIDAYCVMNTRTKGSISPYNTAHAEFADFAHQQTYADLINEGYNGFIPAGTTLNREIPDEATWFKTNGVSEDLYAYFIYEREKPTIDPTFIIVRGTYDPDVTKTGDELKNRYYKVDLRDNRGEYFPIIRNFRYNIELSSVHHEGHASAIAAVSGAGSGDVSTSLETEDYTNISNNVARIFVEYTEKTLVEATNDLKLHYKFMVFETKDKDGNIITNEQVLNSSSNITIELSTAIGGNVVNSWTTATTDDAEGWRELTIATTELAATRKSQDIIIKGQVTIGEKTYKLQRKVTLNLRHRYDMQLVCSPDNIQKKIGEPFDLILKVPGGLGSSMFPLEFELEALAQSITPDQGDDLPVITGKSIIPGQETKTTIGFIKHLEWNDYDALPNEGGYKSVRCHFKSNKAESATFIYAQNQYFNQASTELKNYIASTFSNLTFNPTALPTTTEQNVDFSFTMSQLPSQGYVTVALKYLEPHENETRMTYVGVVDDMACYRFNPTSTTETLKLINTEVEVEAMVKLSAFHFEDASAKLESTFVIPKGNIQVGNQGNNINFYLYTYDPGKDWSTGNSIAQFTASYGGSNNAAIDVTNHYSAIKENGGYIYVQYRTGYSYNRRYYVAKVLLSDLMKTGGAMLNFVQQ